MHFRHLSQSLQRIPRISALTLTVYRNVDKDTRHELAFHVPGRSGVYDVTVDRNTYEVRCSCVASQYGNICRHAIAVNQWCIGNLEKEPKHTMSILDGAIPRERNTDFKRTVITVARGDHKSYFLGIGPEISKEESQFPCGICSGSRIKNGEDCRACAGTGKKHQEKVALRYATGKNTVQEEWVTRSLAAPKQLPNGKVAKASTMWVRLSAISGLQDPEDIKAWYDSLPTRQGPAGEAIVPIPIWLTVVGKEGKPDEVRIGEVRLRDVQAAAAPPPPAETFDDEDDDIPF